jgi:HK97 gp10 family phage protein
MARAQALAARGSARDSISLDPAAFMASLRSALARLVIETEADLWAFGMTAQNLARLYAPVDTGRLRSSIQVTRGRDATGPFLDIGTNVSYAAFVEFGTRYMAAQPYLRPALAVAAAQWGSR